MILRLHHACIFVIFFILDLLFIADRYRHLGDNNLEGVKGLQLAEELGTSNTPIAWATL
jgi:hypothetical protein